MRSAILADTLWSRRHQDVKRRTLQLRFDLKAKLAAYDSRFVEPADEAAMWADARALVIAAELATGGTVSAKATPVAVDAATLAEIVAAKAAAAAPSPLAVIAPVVAAPQEEAATAAAPPPAAVAATSRFGPPPVTSAGAAAPPNGAASVAGSSAAAAPGASLIPAPPSRWGAAAAHKLALLAFVPNYKPCCPSEK